MLTFLRSLEDSRRTKTQATEAGSKPTRSPQPTSECLATEKPPSLAQILGRTTPADLGLLKDTSILRQLAERCRDDGAGMIRYLEALKDSPQAMEARKACEEYEKAVKRAAEVELYACESILRSMLPKQTGYDEVLAAIGSGDVARLNATLHELRKAHRRLEVEAEAAAASSTPDMPPITSKGNPPDLPKPDSAVPGRTPTNQGTGGVGNRKTKEQKVAEISSYLLKNPYAVSKQVSGATGIHETAVRRLWRPIKRAMRGGKAPKTTGLKTTDGRLEAVDESALCRICRSPLVGSFWCDQCNESIVGECTTCHYTNNHPDIAVP